jgi:TolB-like protein/DNA-binding winged helix-turn-helix (wHTH) protein/Flp pilus assembly protein TadD
VSTDLLKGFRLGDLLIEPLSGQVASPTGPRHVQPKAMEVLVCLAESPGELVTREKLLETVWGDPASNPSTLSHAVSELRNALDDQSANPRFIQTLPRRGYRLLVDPVPPGAPASVKRAGIPDPLTPPSSFWTALMKHGVVQAAAAYLIFGWVIIQVAGETFETLGFPPWATKFVTLVVISGFPIVVALSWFLEATGGRLILDRGNQTGRFFQGLERNYLAIVAAYGLAAVCVTLYQLTIGLAPPGEPPGSTASIEAAELEVDPASIAVLRFLNIDGSETTRMFSDGLAEDLLDKLTRVPELFVSSRGDSWSLPPNAPSDLVRRRLRVAYFVEGSVQREGGTLRIVVQLIDSENGFHVISRSFDRDLSEVMGMQREITRLIVANLRVALPEDALSFLVADSEDADVDAYLLYRRGMDSLHQPNSGESLSAAIGFFQQALEIDSDYPAAHAGLCRAYAQSYDFSTNTRYVELAEAACADALTVNSKLDIVHTALGNLYERMGREEETIAAYDRALAINPNSIAAMQGLARAYGREQRFGEAQALLTKAAHLQPGNWRLMDSLGSLFFLAGEYARAAEAYRQVLSIDPDNWQGMGNLGSALLMSGDFDNAAIALQRSVDIEPDLPNLTSLAIIYYYLGRFDESVAIHRQLVDSFPESEVAWMNLADSLLFSSDADEAVDTYRKAAELAQKQLSLNPQDPMVLCRTAWATVMAGEAAGAGGLLRRALDLAPGNPYVHYYDALLKTQRGDLHAALDALSIALANGFPSVMLISEPLLADLKDEERFSALIDVPTGANRFEAE